MNLLLKLFLALGLLAVPGMAATVAISISSNGGPKFATSGGALLVDGSIIRIGVFDLSNGNQVTVQTSNDFNAVNALFKPLGEGIPNAGQVLQSGNTGEQIIINSLIGSGNVLGQINGIEDFYYANASPALSVWVFNSNNTATATEWGIFSASTGWDFPLGIGGETLATFEIDTVLRGVGTGGLTSADQWQLAVVPEPGSALLLLTGATLAARRRRGPAR